MINPFKFIKAMISGGIIHQKQIGSLKRKRKKSNTHPLAGFWKKNKNHDLGIVIGPAGKNLYYISFGDSSGCFKENTYRQNTRIVNDKKI